MLDTPTTTYRTLCGIHVEVAIRHSVVNHIRPGNAANALPEQSLATVWAGKCAPYKGVRDPYVVVRPTHTMTCIPIGPTLLTSETRRPRCRLHVTDCTS